MKVIEKQSSVLTNWEVLNIVREQRGEYDGSDGTGRTRPMPSNLSRILSDVEAQLTEKSSPLAGAHKYRSDAIRTLYVRTRDAGFEIEKAEMLMIFNLRPKSLAELDTIMEELDSRYDEAKQEELLAIVSECLGPLGDGEQEPPEEREGTDWKHDRHRQGGAEIGLDGEKLDKAMADVSLTGNGA
ncbi:RNA polymerase II Rpb4 [Macrophomina phaseolina MS6]|uniref:DNA-directed RNA polymerase III subunit RPC9 n=1 Tax=Macrophomina phaseolina (strain MS6) TaxID=1126212 RepID=K2RBR2_MACPH|nr:RNA polymerase II Rpb4 [Macrophomina phaseolina MS6]